MENNEISNRQQLGQDNQNVYNRLINIDRATIFDIRKRFNHRNLLSIETKIPDSEDQSGAAQDHKRIGNAIVNTPPELPETIERTPEKIEHMENVFQINHLKKSRTQQKQRI